MGLINSTGQKAQEKKRDYSKKVVNRPEVKAIFDGGALWIHSMEGKPDMLSIEVQLNPGTHKIEEGDTIRFTCLVNTYKEPGTKQPDYNVLIARDSKE